MANHAGSNSYSDFEISGNARVHAGNVFGDVHHHHPVTDTPQTDDILKWLRPPDHLSHQIEARKRRAAQTGTWLLNDKIYNKWQRGSTPLLWLHGKAGCSKTTLCSLIIDDLEGQYVTAKNTHVLYFYFSFSDNGKQNYQSLLLSLISQLLRKGVSDDDEELEKACKQNQRHSEVLEPILWSMLCRCGDTYVVLDALDECPEEDGEREEVLNSIQKLLVVCEQVRVLVSSRRETDIIDHMQDLKAESLRITDHNVNSDITTYVLAEIENTRRLNKLEEAVKREIVSEFSSRAGGMFQWAVCQMQQLKRLRIWTSSNIQRALRDMPPTLDETYKRLLSSIDEIYRTSVNAVLQWLVVARHPIPRAELVDICATRVDEMPYLQEADRKPLEDIITVLSSLIEVVDQFHGMDDFLTAEKRDAEEVVPHVVLAHFSVKEFLVSERIRSTAASDYAIDDTLSAHSRAQCCLAYILHVGEWLRSRECRLDGPNFRDEDLAESIRSSKHSLQESYPFIQRAVNTWDTYLRQADIDSDETPKSRLELTLLCDKFCRQLWCLLRRGDGGITQERFASPLYMACLLNLPRTVSQLCAKDPKTINAATGMKGSALAIAAFKGREPIMRILIQAGADINLRVMGKSALGSACCGGNPGTVNFLLNAGADVNCSTGGSTAISEAARSGRVESICLLLDAGADLQLAASGSSPALLEAVKADDIETIRLLLSVEHDFDAPGGRERLESPLFVACSRGLAHVAYQLIQAGADPHLICTGGWTPLQEACRLGNADVVASLASAGVDLDHQTRRCMSALHTASKYCRDEVVEILVQAGVDVNLRSLPHSQTPLEMALLNECEPTRRLRTLKLLLDGGTDVSALPPICAHDEQTADVMRCSGAKYVYHHWRDIHGHREPCVGRSHTGHDTDQVQDAEAVAAALRRW